VLSQFIFEHCTHTLKTISHYVHHFGLGLLCKACISAHISATKRHSWAKVSLGDVTLIIRCAR
jgi:hypothetical protein